MFTVVRRRLGASLLTAAALLAAALPAGAAPDGGLKLLTYNTAFMTIRLSGLAADVDTNDGVWNGLDYHDRAVKIGQKIAASDNDVVVINEAFSDVAKAELVKALSPKYPHYLSRIDGPLALDPADQAGFQALKQFAHLFILGAFPGADWIVGDPLPNDSGLMIFSRYPFVPFTAGATPHRGPGTIVQGVNKGLPWGFLPGQVSVDTYTKATNLDVLAAKAIAMVRVDSPFGIANIAFTHMQADDDLAHMNLPERDHQFTQIKQLIVDSLTPVELASQPVFLMGDLNVVGQMRGAQPPVGSPTEWPDRFDQPTSKTPFFACGDGVCTFKKLQNPGGTFLVDPWGRENPITDTEITNWFENQRLDYVMHNKPDRPLCMQHVTVAWDLGDDQGNMQYSDHLGVRADYNRMAPHCSPNDAAGTFGPLILGWGGPVSPPDNFQQGKLEFPGSVQWYRIDQAGSYSIGLNDPDHFAAVVYGKRDLSTPLVPFEAHSDANLEYDATKYSFPDPPYYIQVFRKNAATGKQDRTQGGTYELMVHQHRGYTPEDAIGIFPGDDTKYVWPANVLPPDQEIWFSFDTELAATGKAPVNEFILANTPGFAYKNFKMRLVKDAPGYPTLNSSTKWAGQYGDMGSMLQNWPQQILKTSKLPGTNNGPKRYFLTIQRKAALANQTLETVMEFRTTLTYFKALRIKVDEEYTWGPAADAITAEFAYDRKGPTRCQKAPCDFTFINDNEIWQPIAPKLQMSYVESLIPTLWDSFGQGSEFWLHPQRFDQWGAETMVIPSLGMATSGVQKDEFVWSNLTDPNFKDQADYWFTMTYWRAHDPRVLASVH